MNAIANMVIVDTSTGSCTRRFAAMASLFLTLLLALSGCRIQSGGPSDRRGDYVAIAVLPGGDERTTTATVRCLSRVGVRSRVEGSLGWTVSVPASQREAAVSAIKADSALHVTEGAEGRLPRIEAR
jgi:hypothetical protein